MELVFPLEFIVYGTPVALGNRGNSKDEWMALVKESSLPHLPEGHFATDRRLALTLFNFPEDTMSGDVDNIIKHVQDALKGHIYLDDRQVERVVVQKFERGRIATFTNPSATLTKCVLGQKPAFYIRVTDDLSEGL